MENLDKVTSQKIIDLKNSIPEIVLEKHFDLNPKLKDHYTNRHKQLYLEDTRYHLSYLGGSIAAGEPILFTEYLGWAKIFFSTLPIDQKDIILNLELVRESLIENMETEQAELVIKYMNAGIDKFIKQDIIPPSFFSDSNPFKEIAEEYLTFLIDGNKNKAQNIIIEAVQKGVSTKDIYQNVFQNTQKETGRLWQLGKITVAQEHFITAATQLIMSQLFPYIFTSAAKEKKIIVTCAAGELHEIGARMVADLFEMDGWNSYYFGANTPQKSIIKAIEQYKPDILAVSVTMTFNLNAVSELIESVRNEPKIKDVKILVGGYPFNLASKLWQNFGADGFAIDAQSAIELASKY